MARSDPDRRERHDPFREGADTGRIHLGGQKEPYPGEVIGRKEPPFQATGTDALAPLLGVVEFPATLDDIVERIGSARIAIDKRHTRRIRDVLGVVGPTRFETADAVIRAVEQAWDRIVVREDRGGLPP